MRPFIVAPVIVAIVVGSVALGSAHAVEPDEVLANAALEARARAISTELRCLVCQNQAIDDSNAPLAKDLRVVVRERLTAGDSDADVRRYVVARYGEFVLLKPTFGWHTLILWATPLALLLATGLALARQRSSGRTRGRPTPLSAREEADLAAIVNDPPAKPPKAHGR